MSSFLTILKCESPGKLMHLFPLLVLPFMLFLYLSILAFLYSSVHFSQELFPNIGFFSLLVAMLLFCFHIDIYFSDINSKQECPYIGLFLPLVTKLILYLNYLSFESFNPFIFLLIFNCSIASGVIYSVYECPYIGLFLPLFLPFLF